MSTITLPNIRVSSDLTVKVRLKDSGVAIDWSTLTKIKASIYSDAQRALAGRCDVSIDAEDSTLLVCSYAANKPQYVGVNRIVVSAKYMGETKTYDKPAFTFVRWTADQEGEQITIDDPDVDVEISVEDISSSILQEAVDAAFEAADRANDAAAAAEHMVDIHTGPEGKSAYEVAVEEGYVGTEEEWLASLVGPQGAQGIQGETGEAAGFGTVSVSLQEDGGQPSATVAASGTDTAKNFAFTFNNLKGEKGDKGDQGNTGSSVDYPYELVNNLTTNDATKGLTAAMGVTLEGEVSQLEAEVTENGFSIQTFDHSTFTSQQPNILVDESTMEMTQAGDYIEIKVDANGTDGYILRRPTSYNQPGIRYSSSDYIQVRFKADVNFTYQNPSLINWDIPQVIKVVLKSISEGTYTYDIYVDDTKVGTQDMTTSAKGLTQIGYNSVMDLFYLKKKIGGVESIVDKFSEMAGAVGVTDVYTSHSYEGLVSINNRVDALDVKNAKLENAVFGEDMYFRFVKQSTLSNIESNFYVLQRIKGNIFIMSAIGYYVYSGGAGYPNGYWRLERTNIGTLINGEWTNIKTQAITAGENEFVLQWLAGSGYNFSGGFSGGFHFGETIDNVPGAWVEFMADGHPIDTSADIPITPCKSFYYREYSPIYQHNDNTIAAWHLKENHFRDGGYEVFNDVKFVQALDYFAYPGIVCVSRWLSEKAMPENVATITDMGDGSSPHYQFQSHANRIHYEGNGYLCDVESEVLIGADDAQCDLSVYNGTDYNKYYRKNPDTAGSVDNRLKARTKVKIAAV